MIGKLKSSIFLTFFVVVVTLQAYSNQAYATSQSMRFWNQIDTFGTFGKDNLWHYQFWLQNRFKFNDDGYDRTIIRAGFGRDVSRPVSLWVGYELNPALDSNSKLQFEQRFWQQVFWKIISTDKLRIRSRTRLEIRDRFEQADTGLSLRQLFIFKMTNRFNKDISPIISDEMFFNIRTTNWLPEHGFEQNRAFIGIAAPFSKNTRISIGYINQLLLRSPKNTLNHIFWLAFTV